MPSGIREEKSFVVEGVLKSMGRLRSLKEGEKPESEGLKGALRSPEKPG